MRTRPRNTGEGRYTIVRQVDVVIAAGRDELVALLPGARERWSEIGVADYAMKQSAQDLHNCGGTSAHGFFTLGVVKHDVTNSQVNGQPAATILVVEDEEAIATAIAQRLRSEGFIVEIAGDGPSGVKRCLALEPDLVVLDIMLPGFDGLEVCRQIQAHRRTPVLMLTARGDETDMLVGLRIGADDYMTKPFSPRELAARVHAILRRVADLPTADATPADSNGDASGAPDTITIAPFGVEIDIPSRRVTRGAENVHLTPTEFNLLVTLARADGKVLTREALLAKVWGYQDSAGARTVDSHIRAVRRKLEPDLIRTVHAVGYAIGDSHATDPDSETTA